MYSSFPAIWTSHRRVVILQQCISFSVHLLSYRRILGYQYIILCSKNNPMNSNIADIYGMSLPYTPPPQVKFCFVPDHDPNACPESKPQNQSRKIVHLCEVTDEKRVRRGTDVSHPKNINIYARRTLSRSLFEKSDTLGMGIFLGLHLSIRSLSQNVQRTPRRRYRRSMERAWFSLLRFT